MSISILIRSLQPIEDPVIDLLVQHLESIFESTVKVDKSQLDLSFTYAPNRKQYRSTPILLKLKRELPDRFRACLGLVNEDLFAEGKNFIFGEAEVGGRVSIISLSRLRCSSLELFYIRVCKEATHELGHVMGLNHCSHPKCVMYFSINIDDTDKKLDRFCPDCAHTLAETIYKDR
jgi:archaemetzincin